ncbi:Mn-containing catalase OS=Ureibacillus acetophenoni OX=614649 GN=SAMN05877842_102316 PE=3 SV=1 [Ureibacillus acetophenoni]
MLYTWSETEYRDIGMIWKGTNPENGQPLEVKIGTPVKVEPIPNLEELPEEFAPGITRDDY